MIHNATAGMGNQVIKIAYFIDRLINGGTELQLVEQINRLEGDGFEQFLFCMYKSDEHDSIPIKCRTEILDIRSLMRVDSALKVLSQARYLKRQHIDVVQTYFFDSMCLGVLCGSLARVERVVSCRRDMGFWYTPKHLFFLRLCNLLANRILVNSTCVKENVVRYEKVVPQKVDVIRNGLQVASFRDVSSGREKARQELSIERDEMGVGLVANMSRPVKRVDLLVEAARILVSRGIKVKFFLLGEGYLKAELQERVRSYGLSSQVIFLDKNFDKRCLLSALDIATLTSDSEGLSNALMEYMAAGIPSVVSDVEGNLELIKSDCNGLVFKRGSFADLSEKLLQLIQDPIRRRELGKQAAEDIRDYDWQNRTAELKRYYRDLLAE